LVYAGVLFVERGCSRGVHERRRHRVNGLSVQDNGVDVDQSGRAEESPNTLINSEQVSQTDWGLVRGVDADKEQY